MVEAAPDATATLAATITLSFAEVVSNGGNIPISPRLKVKSFEELLSDGKCHVKNPGIFKGEPVVFFTKKEISSLASPFRFSLIDKFSFGRPPMLVIRKFFSSLGLKSLKSVGLLQENHVFILLTQEEDYYRLISLSIWYVSGSPMKIIKWSPDFFPSYESPVVPVWTTFPGLPIHLFEKSVLYSLGSIFGTPLKLDEATALLTRPTVARICIEMDVSKSRNQRIWIGDEKEGYWQKVVLENPPYCIFCKMIGHEEINRYIKNPNLKMKSNKEEKKESPFVQLKEKKNVKEIWKKKVSDKGEEEDWQVIRRKNKKVQDELPSSSGVAENKSVFSSICHTALLKSHTANSKQEFCSSTKQKEIVATLWVLKTV